MAKKLTALLLAALLSLSVLALSSCDKEDAEGETTTAGESQAEGAGETEGETAGEAATDAPVTEPEETDPPKPRDTYDYITLFDGDGPASHSPHSLMAEGSSVAVRIKFDQGYLTDGHVAAPSWSDNVGNLTVKIYPWNTDYATTIAGEPVYSEEFVDYPDNTGFDFDCTGEDSLGLAAGEYLWWVGDGVDAGGSGVGLWVVQYPSDEKVVEVYSNGELTDAFGPEVEINILIPGEAQ